jgi:hypothetical protein
MLIFQGFVSLCCILLFCTKCTKSTRNFINKRQPNLFPNNMYTHTERIKAINLDRHECK